MKYTIVTPTYNMARWLPETIESVLSQEGDFEIEYIVVDGNSTDETLTILEGYKQRLDSGNYPVRCKNISMHILSRLPTGMYAAINAGFAEATGEVYAWINSDDIYVSGAFERMRQVFETFSEVVWAKGTCAVIDTNSNPLRAGIVRIYRQDWLAKGIYGMQSYFVEQDSVFWRASLWKEAGGIPEHLRYAGDYWLWIQFAKRHKLWTLNAAISCYRKREGQLGMNVPAYKGEQKRIQGIPPLTAQIVRLFFSPQSRFPSLSKFFVYLYPIIFGRPKEPDYIDLSTDVPTKKYSASFGI